MKGSWNFSCLPTVGCTSVQANQNETYNNNNSPSEKNQTYSIVGQLPDNDEEFVFQSRPIENHNIEPIKILLFIASAEGFHHTDLGNTNEIDPRLSDKGIRQCKIVRRHLRKAQQIKPDILLCSTLHRALSTMKLVCADWYGIVPCESMDILRPPYGVWSSNRRSSITFLVNAFRKASFKYTEGVTDKFWKEHEELEIQFKERIKLFVHNYLKNLTYKRIVIISHREYYNVLFNHIVEASPELQTPWKHCDLRKVFVYNKKQLQLLSFQPTLSPKSSSLSNNNNNSTINNDNNNKGQIKKLSISSTKNQSVLIYNDRNDDIDENDVFNNNTNNNNNNRQPLLSIYKNLSFSHDVIPNQNNKKH